MIQNNFCIIFIYDNIFLGGIKMKLYKCPKCQNLVEVLEEKSNNLICCNEHMQKVKAGAVDAAKEKHVPYCEVEEDSVYVRIGEVTHPMEENHYIEWIAAEYSDSVVKHYYKPGEVPEAVFDYEDNMKIYAYCNLHGLWEKIIEPKNE